MTSAMEKNKQKKNGGGDQWAMREDDLRGDRKVKRVSHAFGYLGKKVEGIPDTCKGPEAREHPKPPSSPKEEKRGGQCAWSRRNKKEN